MRTRLMPWQLLLVFLVGCQGPALDSGKNAGKATPDSAGDHAASQPSMAASEGQTVKLLVTKASEHLGHNMVTDARGSQYHSVWCDGCRGKLVPTNEEFIVYWVNNAIRDTPFRFEEGKTYSIRFRGEIAPGVMGFTGKCVDIRQVISAEPVKD